MTPHEFYEELQATLADTPNAILELSMGEGDGGLSFNVSKEDAMAAKLMLWLEEQMPDDTLWDVFEVLDAAHWWATFWTSLSRGEAEDFEKVTPSPCHDVEIEVQ